MLLLSLAAWMFPLVRLANSNPNSDEDSWDGDDGHYPRHDCLSDHSAAKIVDAFEDLYVHIDVGRAKKYLAVDFEVFSDSINFITPGANMTPGAVTTATRDAFVKQQQATQATPQPVFTNLAIYHTCDTITFRWHLNFPVPIAGIDVLIIQQGSHVIQTDYSEFNNVGLLEGFGCHINCG